MVAVPSAPVVVRAYSYVCVGGDVKPVSTLVLYDGGVWSRFACDRTADGTLRYTRSGVKQEVSAASAVELDGIYVLAADGVQLATESQFHRERRRLAMAALFRNTGDFMELLRLGGFAALIVLGIWSTTTIGALSGSIGRLQGEVQQVQSTLSQPIKIEVPSVPSPGRSR